jgi:hypothetical protein
MPTVLIWNNKMYGSHSYSGHASMSIDDQWGKEEQAQSYVSWWPDHDHQVGGIGKSKPKVSISADLQAEGYAPDHIIDLSRMATGAMLGVWNEIRTSTKYYRYLRRNCSTVVSQVLKAGSKLGSFSERNNLIWTPVKVKDLALSMGGQKVTWESFLQTLRQDKYLTRSDVVVLSQLLKRDEAHGKDSTGNNAYYSNGRKVVAKPWLKWDITNGQGFSIGNAKSPTSYFFSSSGSILSTGTVRTNTDNNKLEYTPNLQRVQVGS